MESGLHGYLEISLQEGLACLLRAPPSSSIARIDTCEQRHMNLILKSLLLSLCGLILTAMPVHAREKSWYEIDGIRFRYGSLQFSPDIKIYHERIIVNTASVNIISPVALALPEKLMSSFSFRGGVIEFVNQSFDDMTPLDHENSTHYRQSPTQRDHLNSWFNDDDKSYISGKDLWALSADGDMKALFFGYYWGLFIPVGNNHRFFKIGTGIGAYYADIGIKLNLCSEFKKKGGETNLWGEPIGKCEGKYEIDSARAIAWRTDGIIYINLWERVTEDSVFSIYRRTFNTGWSRTSLSFSKHEGLRISPRFYFHEIFAYDYRF